MYTGIVQGMEKILDVQEQPDHRCIAVSNMRHFFDDVAVGASVAIDGVCLTVVAYEQQAVWFDISNLTLASTTLTTLVPGHSVNVERSLRSGQENGGHSLYGHVEGVAEVLGLSDEDSGISLRIHIHDGKIRYFFHKGFIGLHGCSLTVHQVDAAASVLTLNLIPETLRLTNLHAVRTGDVLNYEIDQSTRVMVDTLSRLLGGHP